MSGLAEVLNVAGNVSTASEAFACDPFVLWEALVKKVKVRGLRNQFGFCVGLTAKRPWADRALQWGFYTIPLYYLGHDLVAYRARLGRPDTTPLYGMVVETWWDENAQKGAQANNSEK